MGYTPQSLIGSSSEHQYHWKAARRKVPRVKEDLLTSPVTKRTCKPMSQVLPYQL